MSRSRKLLLPLLALCAIVAIAPATASARTEKKQDSAITKAQKNIRSLGAKLATLTSDQRSTAATLKTIVDAAPQLINGLTALKDGLTTLGAAYQSVEYGVVHAQISGADAFDLPNQYSGDIPDDGNAAQVTGALPYVPQTTGLHTVTLRASIRSAEGDGKATGDPAGEVGAAAFVTCANVGGCDPDGPGPAPASAGSGALVCTPGVTPANNYQYLNPSTNQISPQQLVPIQQAAARTDQSRPSDDPTDAYTVSATLGNKCTFFGVAGNVYMVQGGIQFFDLPTSTTPGATD